MTKAERDIRRKLRVFKHAQQSGNVDKTYRYFGISMSIFYRWRARHKKYCQSGLINSKPRPENPKLRTASEIEEKNLHLRKTYYLEPNASVGISSDIPRDILTS